MTYSQKRLQPNVSLLSVRNITGFSEQPNLEKIQTEQLFSVLLFTILGCLVFGNLLLLSDQVLWVSIRVGGVGLAFVALLYASHDITKSLVWAFLLVFGLMWLIATIPTIWARTIFGFAVVIAVHRTFRVFRFELTDWYGALMLAAIGTATVMGVSNAYTSFDMAERLLSGYVHKDTLFHSSIAAMIKNYGVASTGLHGLVETPYHTFSHTLMASLSKLSGVGVVETYGVATSALFAPLLLFSLTYLGLVVAKGYGRQDLSAHWMLICAWIAVVPVLLSSWVVGKSFFVSESHLVALILFSAGMLLLYQRQLGWADVFAVLLISAVLANAKASVGLIFAGLWLVRLIFLSRDTRFMTALAAFCSLLISFWVVTDSASAHAEKIVIFPLDFIVQYSLFGSDLEVFINALMGQRLPAINTAFLATMSVIGFFVFHFLPSWVVIGTMWRRKGWRYLFYDARTLYAGATLFAGAVIVVLFQIAGGSVGYFSGVAMFVALPLIASIVLPEKKLSIKAYEATKFAILIIVTLFGIKGFWHSSMVHPRYESEHENYLIKRLEELRKTEPLAVILQPTKTMIEFNPVSPCSAKPFLYPALSERPWHGVMDQSGNCEYKNYSYEMYRSVDLSSDVSALQSLESTGLSPETRLIGPVLED